MIYASFDRPATFHEGFAVARYLYRDARFAAGVDA